MQLYLASSRHGGRIDIFARQLRDGPVAVVGNAEDHLPASLRGEKMDGELARLRNSGLDVAEFDLRDFSGTLTAQDLSGFGGLWVRGGNVFVLAAAMARSGFAAIAKDVLAGGLAYGGYSAGACIAGNTLEGLDRLDDPSIVAGAWHPLGLLPFAIVPHYRSGHRDNTAVERTAAYMATHQIDHVKLADGQVLVAGGDTWLIVK